MLSVEVTEINFWLFAPNQMTANHHKSFQSLGFFDMANMILKFFDEKRQQELFQIDL